MNLDGKNISYRRILLIRSRTAFFPRFNKSRSFSHVPETNNAGILSFPRTTMPIAPVNLLERSPFLSFYSFFLFSGVSFQLFRYW